MLKSNNSHHVTNMKICIISLTRISQKKKVFRNVLVRNEVQIYNLDQCVCIYVYTYICIHIYMYIFQIRPVSETKCRKKKKSCNNFVFPYLC